MLLMHSLQRLWGYLTSESTLNHFSVPLHHRPQNPPLARTILSLEKLSYCHSGRISSVFSLLWMASIFLLLLISLLQFLIVNHIFIKCSAALKAGHLHDFGNGVFLISIQLFGTSQVAWFYLVNCLWPPSSSPTSTRCL
jgi:hypothetical protein